MIKIISKEPVKVIFREKKIFEIYEPLKVIRLYAKKENLKVKDFILKEILLSYNF
jgi:hypothetical protein